MRTAVFNQVDSLFFNSDLEESPRSVDVHVRFEGRVDERRLAEAIRAATQVHPMARARMRPFGRASTRYYWEIPQEIDRVPLSVLDARNEEALWQARSRLQSIKVPLSTSPPFLIELVHRPDGDWLMINASHTAVDGLSAIRILQSVMRQYGGEADPVPDVDPLAVRDLKRLASPASFAQRLARWRFLLASFGRAVQPPIRVVPRPSNNGKPGEGVYAIELLPFSVEETQRLNARRQRPVTVNDMLVAGLMLTIREWNRRAGGKAGRISIMVSASLRPEEWRFEVVGNFSTYVSVSLPEEAQTSFARASEEVSAQMARLKEVGAAGAVIELIDVPLRLPAAVKGLLPRLFPVFARSETTILGNLGRLPPMPSMGEAGRVMELYLTAPVARTTCVTLCAVSMNDRLFLGLRYRQEELDRAAAREFAALLRSTLLEG